MKRFRSNGKFLITGEYLVLAGAKALAVPLKSGQSMDIDTDTNTGKLIWEVSDPAGRWFSAEISLPELNLISSSDDRNTDFLIRSLKTAREMNPSFLTDDNGVFVNNHLEFDRNWGMGSSSSFLSNLSRWAGIDPFRLHEKTSQGSAYDIACATAESPIIFERHFEKILVEPVRWHPSFFQNIAFVYLGNKQSSAASISNFRELDIKDVDIKKINQITDEIWLVNNLCDFNQKIRDHEDILSRILKIPPVQEKLFSDFPGAIKSLGAWGGDFIMASGLKKFKKSKKYFEERGFDIVLPWSIILQ